MAFLQGKSAYNAGSPVVLTLDSPATPGSVIVVSIHVYAGNEAATTVTDSAGNTYSKIVWQIGGDLSLALALYYAVNASSAPLTITVNTAGGFCSVGALEHSQLDTASPLDTFAAETGSSAAPNAGPLTPANADTLLIASMTSMAGGLNPITPDPDYIQRLEFENGATEIHLSIQDRTLSAVIADTADWTLSTPSQWIAVLAAFKLSPAGPEPITITPTPATARALSADPAASLGSLIIAPVRAFVRSSIAGASASLGSLIITPARAFVRPSAQTPAVSLGSLIITPVRAFVRSLAADPAVNVSGFLVIPARALARALARPPSVSLGSLALSLARALARTFAGSVAVLIDFPGGGLAGSVAVLDALSYRLSVLDQGIYHLVLTETATARLSISDTGFDL